MEVNNKENTLHCWLYGEEKVLEGYLYGVYNIHARDKPNSEPVISKFMEVSQHILMTAYLSNEHAQLIWASRTQPNVIQTSTILWVKLRTWGGYSLCSVGGWDSRKCPNLIWRHLHSIFYEALLIVRRRQSVCFEQTEQWFKLIHQKLKVPTKPVSKVINITVQTTW